MRSINRRDMRRASIRLALMATLLVAIFGLSETASAATTEGAVIGNGTTQLGVTKYGSLNYDCVDEGDTGCPASSYGGTDAVGLRLIAQNFEATAPGCLCEGWGVADAGSLLSGWANEASGDSNITVDSFSSPNPQEATSTVTIADPTIPSSLLQVTHHYFPNPISANVYNGRVTVKNIGAAGVTDLRYRRVMDWDVEPTAFNEWVTIQGSTPQLMFDSDNGFASSNPLSGPSYEESQSICGVGYTGTCSFTDLGNGSEYPSTLQGADHGALFDFSFGALASGESKTFTVIYGAAPDEPTALNALSSTGAQVYSLGQPNCPDEVIITLAATNACSGFNSSSGPVEGKPVTFMFAFITTQSDVSITKTAATQDAVVGDLFDYTLNVTNTGNEPAAVAQVNDQLASGTEFVSATPTQGVCTGTTTVECALGSLAPGATATVTIRVKAIASGTAVNSATVTTASADPNPANNSASATVNITNPPPVPIVAAADTAGPTVRASRFAKCINSSLRIAVRASDPSGIASVVLRVDGKKVKSFNVAPVKTGISVKRLRRGRHRLEVVVTDVAGNSRVTRRSFTRCAKPARTVRRISPRFTG